MATRKSIEFLTWSETSYTLRTFLENFDLPNLVRISEGHYGINEACTFEDDQVIMFHGLRYRKNLIGEDSAGRPIAIPLEGENKFLVCPLPDTADMTVSLFPKCPTSIQKSSTSAFWKAIGMK